jgi:hypothetical protein
VTEAEWLACADLIPLLEALPDPSQERKLRLFACACARSVWHHLDDERSRKAVEVAERFADGQAATAQAVAAGRAALEASRSSAFDTPQALAAGAAAATLRAFVTGEEVASGHLAARVGARRAAHAANTGRGVFTRSGEWGPDEWDPAEREMVPLLRDIIGNPFRPATITPAWRTPQVVALARAAYDQRELPWGQLDPTRLAVLADALEEVGCTDQAILDHLRGPDPHVRGCWAVDLLLGKE